MNQAADRPVQATIHWSTRAGSIPDTFATTLRRASRRPGSVGSEVGIGEDVSEVERAFAYEAVRVDGKPTALGEIEDVLW
jgi:hypothetical protein